MSLNENDSIAVENFRKYLKYPTVHPNINYHECVAFLINLGQHAGLAVQVYSPKKNKPIVIMTLAGSNPDLPTLLLNSHMDVVSVHRKYWKHEPFGAEMDEDGNIYGRGAQDMKCVGIQYVEALRRCIQNGQHFKRTVYVSFVPDEETGGKEGMGTFVNTDEFKAMNVGCVLDESMPSPGDEFILCYAERVNWLLEIVCTGVTGHASLLPNDLAADKFRYVINKFLDFKEGEKRKLQENSNLTIGDVTTVNMVSLEGGVQLNVIPSKLSAIFALRVAIDVNLTQLRNTIEEWCHEAGDGVTCNELTFETDQIATKLDDSNMWWLAFKEASSKMGLKLKTVVFAGRTDSKFLRRIGIPAIGFSPMNHTPILMHDHDEYLNEKIFLRGIEIYKNIITNLANI
ncbi:hypothetical protein V9T40_009936 [Parthenolecanium corni]|uniref:N-acyl-aliphatic-L-amino acid amidohydrolase n=1 Tax=Parthenolecanium corni TaxID=536013 RepID=A0AAN9Y770_9HEMI